MRRRQRRRGPRRRRQRQATRQPITYNTRLLLSRITSRRHLTTAGGHQNSRHARTQRGCRRHTNGRTQRQRQRGSPLRHIPTVNTRIMNNFRRAPIRFFRNQMGQRGRRQRGTMSRPSTSHRIIMRRNSTAKLQRRHVRTLHSPTLFTRSSRPNMITSRRINPRQGNSRRRRRVTSTQNRTTRPWHRQGARRGARRHHTTNLGRQTRRNLNMGPVRLRFAIRAFLRGGLRMAIRLPVNLPISAAMGITQRRTSMARSTRQGNSRHRRDRGRQTRRRHTIRNKEDTTSTRFEPPSASEHTTTS